MIYREIWGLFLFLHVAGILAWDRPNKQSCGFSLKFNHCAVFLLFLYYTYYGLKRMHVQLEVFFSYLYIVPRCLLYSPEATEVNMDVHVLPVERIISSL